MAEILRDRGTALRLLELATVIVLAHYFSTWASEGTAALGLPLPEMPLLKHVYLFFSVTVMVCIWIRMRGESFAEFGLIVPTHWLRYLWQGFLIFLAAMLWDVLARPVIDPWIAHATGTNPVMAEQHFAALHGNVGLLLYLIPCAWIFGGFGEEFLYRGFIMTRAAQLLGGGRGAWIAAIFIQAIPFALGHGYQGPVGMTSIFVLALIDGTGRVLTGNLWPLIIAHGIQDTFGFAAMYSGIAHE
jgi:membrane protease YdiL (CAAX protease family)